MLNSQERNSGQGTHAEVKVRQRKTVRERPLLGAPSVGFKLTNGSSAFVNKLSVSLEKVEQAADRRDASRALLFLQQVYKGGRQFYSAIPSDLQARVEASLHQIGVQSQPIQSTTVTFPLAIREKLDRVLGIV